MMTKEEIEQLEQIFDGRYVQKDDCTKTVDKENEKINKLSQDVQQLKVEIAKMNTKLGILIGILSAIGVPLISVCVKMLFGG